MNLFNKSEPIPEFFFFDDLTCGMSYKLDLDLKSFTGTAFRQQIFYRNGVPDRSGLLSPLLLMLTHPTMACSLHKRTVICGCQFLAPILAFNRLALLLRS